MRTIICAALRPSVRLRIARFVGIAILSVPFLEPVRAQSTKPVSAESASVTVADKDWSDLESLLPNATGRQAGRVAKPEWALIARQARQFKEVHGNDDRSKKIRKIELVANLHLEEENEELAPATKKCLVDFLEDQTLPAEDRFDISAMSKARELKVGKNRQVPDPRAVREKHARELIREFPQDPRGYGYLLSTAQFGKSRGALEVAQEIIDNRNVPEAIKNRARLLRAQRQLEGKPLSIKGVDLAKFRGRPLLIYSWTIKQPEIFRLVEGWAKGRDLGIIGVNVDENTTAAENLTRSISVPGAQYYDRQGLDGTLTSQFKFTMPCSVYLVDADGVLRDVNGYEDTADKLVQLETVKKGGRP